ncbi:MAG: hypothetical protein KGL39_52510, partial [Patescibacteria group bacterium]|nr:hypothetical protein [Patescibacteria group bacterium]
VLDTCFDTMWLRGRGIIKAYVDPFNDYRIVHESIDPIYLLIADTANDFEDADEWIHVRQISVAKFKRDRRYFNRTTSNKDMPDSEVDRMVNLLRGGKDVVGRLKTNLGRDFDMIQQDKELREGFTHSASADTIIIWEHTVKTLGGYLVTPYCPVAMDVEIRKPYPVPYKVNGKITAGFFSFPAERKDEGWYSPRGVGEKVADKEIYACKMWNAKADAITFFNTPMLTSETPIQNPSNYRQVPGEYIPGNVRPVQFGQPAISFDQEISFARGEAEMASQSVDTSIEKPGTNKGEKRTAKEVGIASSIAQIGNNYSGSITMQALAKLLAFDWGLCLQYKRKNLTYFIADDLQTLPEQALHDEYLITAGGSTDDWDRGQKRQMAGQLLEALGGKPNVNQDELTTNFINTFDARLAKKLVMPMAQKAASEAEDEAMEIVILSDGFPAMVKPGEDHLTRIKVLLGWMQKQGLNRAPVDPQARQRIQEHLAVHMKYLKQLQPKAYSALMQQIKAQERQPMQRPPMPAPMAPRGIPTPMRVIPVGGQMRAL